jgi:heat shock protein HslJ
VESVSRHNEDQQSRRSRHANCSAQAGRLDLNGDSMKRLTNSDQSEPSMDARALAVHSRLFALILLGAMLVSCSGLSPVAPSQPVITNVLWKLSSFQRSDFPKIEIQNPEQFTVRFGEDGRVAIRADCNTCTGSYELSGQQLRLGVLACTRAYCGNDSLDTEYLRALDAATVSSTAEGALRITGPSVVLTFRQ